MFLLNSCLGHFSAAACAALLLPKLRSHFAEFLNNTSPAGLRILSSSTCVGLRYGPLLHDSGFSRQEGAAASLLHFAPHHAFVLCRADFPTLRLLRLHRAFHSRLCFPSRVPAVLITRGAGILNLLSIGYASLPLLRPRLTQSRSAYSGNLGYSAARILTLLSLLIPAFSLLPRPHMLSLMLLPTTECSSTTYIVFQM